MNIETVEQNDICNLELNFTWINLVIFFYSIFKAENQRNPQKNLDQTSAMLNNELKFSKWKQVDAYQFQNDE